MSTKSEESRKPQPVPVGAGSSFEEFVRLIARLRAPGGCPWDAEQTHESIKPMTIEEAYEVGLAIDEKDDDELRGELGDLLLQVVFHADIAARRGAFDVEHVIDRVADKMVRRHPHVFGAEEAETSDDVLRNWEAIKRKEREAKGKPDGSLLDSVASALPAIMEAYQMTVKAGRVGFDWPTAAAVLDKLDEEVAELKEAVRTTSAAGAGLSEKREPHAPPEVLEEVGDLLFVAVNVARLLGADPESALKASNRKFRRRFRHVESRLREKGLSPADSTLDAMDQLWNEAKSLEKRRS
jgi:MazG family protein